MGRRYNKKKFRSKRKERNSSITSTGSTEDNPSWSAEPGGWVAENRGHLLAYLTQYQKSAIQICQHGISSSRKSAPVEIGGIEFPALTDKTVAQPYLMLPDSLTPKQRRVVHEICIDIELFHAAVGESRDDRILVVSVYMDGFEYVPDLKKPTNNIALYRYSPWFCRQPQSRLEQQKQQPSTNAHDADRTPIKSNVRRKENKLGRQAVERLIDQPGDCLRDDTDILDFELLEKKDLSSIPPPDVNDKIDSWMLVDTAEKMRACVAELSAAQPSEIAFDVEAYNRSKYHQLTCLLQVTSNAGKEYVIDTLAPGVWDEVNGLAPLFADPSIVKVGHSIGGLDISCLHRDFGIFTVNAFDTYEAAKVLDLESSGLASVCEHYGLVDSLYYKELKETYQSCDWNKRPLTRPMLEYARSDIHYLIKLRLLMMRDLTRAELYDFDPVQRAAEERMAAESLAITLRQIQMAEDDDMYFDEDNVDVDEFISTRTEDDETFFSSQENKSFETCETDVTGRDGETTQPCRRAAATVLRLQPRLMQVLTNSQLSCKGLWNSQTENHLSNKLFLHITSRAQQQEVDWDSSNMRLYDELAHWRDQIATELECLPGFVLPLDALVQIAYKRPTTETALRQLSYFLPELLEDSGYRSQLLNDVRQHLENDRITERPKVFYKYSDRNVHEQPSGKRPTWALALVAATVAVAGLAVALSVSKRRGARA